MNSFFPRFGLFKKACLLLATVSLYGCTAINPFIQDFNVISVAQEQELGQNMAAQVASEMKIVDNTALYKQVNEIGRRLAASLPQVQFNYEFHVIEDPTPNAFTIPGGKIYVHTGIQTLATSTDELAGVLAHEIGHAYERHPTKSLSRAYGIQQLAGMLFKENQVKLKALTLSLAQGSFLTKYGRDDEREADELGFYLLQRAGYRTDGLLSFLKKIQKIQGTTQLPFLSTHPPTPERIQRLESLQAGQPLTHSFVASNRL